MEEEEGANEGPGPRINCDAADDAADDDDCDAADVMIVMLLL
jgi:hypothetical protein